MSRLAMGQGSGVLGDYLTAGGEAGGALREAMSQLGKRLASGRVLMTGREISGTAAAVLGQAQSGRAARRAALLGAPADHAAARRSRDAFIGWCNARPEHTDWRVAWTLYAKPAPAPPPASTDGGPVIETPPLRCGLCHEDEVHGGQCQNCGATVIDAPQNAAPMPQTRSFAAQAEELRRS